MTTVADLAAWLEGFAPQHLAEPWDNVGLLWGDPESAVGRVMTCLTVTPRTAAEAIRERAELIVSHHPVLFKGAKAIRADRPETAPLWTLARSGTAIISPHTALDNTTGGMNDVLADRLGLVDVGPLRPSAGPGRFKLTVFAPEGDRAAVLDAAFRAGAGRIGNYAGCSFRSAGLGTFVPGPGANPTLGAVGRAETAEEWRVEFVCPSARLVEVLAAIRTAHSYEEPAIDVVALEPAGQGPGVGRIGRLAEVQTLGAFASRVASALDAPGTQFVGDPARLVGRVAIACGAGDDFLVDAIRVGADVLLTGEARFHRALEAEASGIGLVVAGHHATERPGVDMLAGRIARAFPDLVAWASRDERDPLRNPEVTTATKNPRDRPGA